MILGYSFCSTFQPLLWVMGLLIWETYMINYHVLFIYSLHQFYIYWQSGFVILYLQIQVILSQRDNDMSRKLMKMLNQFRESDPSYFQQCHLVRQGEQPREGFLLLTSLVEDQISGANGYADWMLLLFRQVQQNT